MASLPKDNPYGSEASPDQEGIEKTNGAHGYAPLQNVRGASTEEEGTEIHLRWIGRLVRRKEGLRLELHGLVTAGAQRYMMSADETAAPPRTAIFGTPTSRGSLLIQR